MFVSGEFFLSLQAVDQMENCNLADEEEERTMEKTCLTLYLNASICGIKTGNWKNAAHFARKVGS